MAFKNVERLHVSVRSEVEAYCQKLVSNLGSNLKAIAVYGSATGPLVYLYYVAHVCKALIRSTAYSGLLIYCSIAKHFSSLLTALHKPRS
jgi:hypothetical protein